LTSDRSLGDKTSLGGSTAAFSVHPPRVTHAHASGQVGLRYYLQPDVARLFVDRTDPVSGEASPCAPTSAPQHLRPNICAPIAAPQRPSPNTITRGRSERRVPPLCYRTPRWRLTLREKQVQSAASVWLAACTQARASPRAAGGGGKGQRALEAGGALLECSRKL